MPQGFGEEFAQGPQTELQTDLQVLFDQCTETATSLLELLRNLEGSGAMSRAIKLARVEGKIIQIRNTLDQHVLAILFVLGEDQNKSDTETRDMILDLKKDFYRFHKNVVTQIPASVRQLEIAARDFKDSLLKDLEPFLSARNQESESSSLRLLGGHQDLLQNLKLIERNFHHALRSGENSLAARIQGQLSEQQATTRSPLESVSQRQQDDMHLYLQQLHEEVTTHLDRFEKDRNESSAEIRAPHFHVKASFEFTYRSNFLAFHISHGMEWVSSNVRFPKIKQSIPGTVYVPIPRIQFGLRIECKAFDTAPRGNPLNVVIQWKPNRYHLFKLDLSEARYQHDMSKAITMLYSSYRACFWKPCSLRRIVGVEYVKYGSYSTEMNCFQSIEAVTARPSAGAPSKIGDEGYAVFLREDFHPMYIIIFGAIIILTAVGTIIPTATVISSVKQSFRLFELVMLFQISLVGYAIVTTPLLAFVVLCKKKLQLTEVIWMGSWLAYTFVFYFYRRTWQVEALIVFLPWLVIFSAVQLFKVRGHGWTERQSPISLEWKEIRLSFLHDKGSRQP